MLKNGHLYDLEFFEENSMIFLSPTFKEYIKIVHKAHGKISDEKFSFECQN